MITLDKAQEIYDAQMPDEDDDYIECDRCGDKVSFDDTYSISANSRYCPDCYDDYTGIRK